MVEFDLEQLKKDAVDCNHSLNLAAKYLEIKNIEETRLWLGFGNIEYLLKLHEFFKQQHGL